MNPEALLDRLIDANVLAPVDDGELQPTAEFETALADRREDAPEAASAVRDPTADAADLIAVVDVLDEFLPELDESDGVRAAAALGCFEQPTRADGTPEGFVPVPAGRLPFFLAAFSRAIVYVWREDCPPCDKMRSDLEEAFADANVEVALLSVFGPDAPRVLREEYDVAGGPTTLFVEDGRVESRLIGANEPSYVRDHLASFREDRGAR
jgi:thiol-disulfide isomerase/thioredoxin